MFSKNMILFFCVPLYFLQCQGAGPDKEQLQLITRIVEENLKPNGLSYEELFIVFHKVKLLTGLNGHLPSRVQLKEGLKDFTFTKEEVVIIAKNIVGNDSMTGFITELFEKDECPAIADFELLSSIILQIRVLKNMHICNDRDAQLKEDLMRHMFPTGEVDVLLDFFVDNLDF